MTHASKYNTPNPHAIRHISIASILGNHPGRTSYRDTRRAFVRGLGLLDFIRARDFIRRDLIQGGGG